MILQGDGLQLVVMILLGSLGAEASGIGYSWTTESNGSKRFEKAQQILPAQCTSKPDAIRLNLNPRVGFQEIDGFGANLTESSAMLLQALPAATRRKILNNLFRPQTGGLQFLRVPIGANDFSVGDYTCQDNGPRDEDFDFARCMKNILPTLQEILLINPHLQIMASPWTAPAWMKDNQKLRHAGSLLRVHFEAYTKYLARYYFEMHRRGIRITHMTVLNEPLVDHGLFPQMYMKAEDQRDLLGQYVGPLFQHWGIPVKLVAFDHNWDASWYPETILQDDSARRYVNSVSFHCYNGEIRKIEPFMNKYPDIEMHMTECSNSFSYLPGFRDYFVWGLENLILLNARYGGRSSLMWNLALDSKGEPRNDGCVACRGVVTIENQVAEYNSEYYFLKHAQQAWMPRSRRIEVQGEGHGVQAVAARNPDGSYGTVIWNSSAEMRHVQVATTRGCWQKDVAPGVAVTLRQ